MSTNSPIGEGKDCDNGSNMLPTPSQTPADAQQREDLQNSQIETRKNIIIMPNRPVIQKANDVLHDTINALRIENKALKGENKILKDENVSYEAVIKEQNRIRQDIAALIDNGMKEIEERGATGKFDRTSCCSCGLCGK
jgi:hypothetical protein